MKDHEIGEWLIIANEDLNTAEDIKEKHFVNSYYHCSQAVEKYLKCYLFTNNVKINKNHYLTETLDRCIKYDNSFMQILPECDKMTQLVKNLRYPGRTIPTKEDIEEAINLIKTIKELKPIKELYNNLIKKYGENWEDILFRKDLTIETDVSLKNKNN